MTPTASAEPASLEAAGDSATSAYPLPDTGGSQALAGAALDSLTEDQVAVVAERGRVERWPDGALIMEEGMGGPRMVVLLEGTVEILKRDGTGITRQITQVGPGGVLGEVALLCDVPRSATVQAAGPIKAFAMDRAVFRELLGDDDAVAARVGLALARVLAARLIRLDARVADLLGQVEGKEPLEEFTRFRHELFTRWECT